MKKFFRVLLLENVGIKRALWPTFPSGRAAAEEGRPQTFGCISAIFLDEHNCESSENTKLLILPGQARVGVTTCLSEWWGSRRDHNPSRCTVFLSHRPCFLCTGAHRCLTKGKTQWGVFKSYSSKIKFKNVFIMTSNINNYLSINLTNYVQKNYITKKTL